MSNAEVTVCIDYGSCTEEIAKMTEAAYDVCYPQLEALAIKLGGTLIESVADYDYGEEEFDDNIDKRKVDNFGINC
jgi:uncharacterized Fe-S cluster-containing radical SAM superfamily protein